MVTFADLLKYINKYDGGAIIKIENSDFHMQIYDGHEQVNFTVGEEVEVCKLDYAIGSDEVLVYPALDDDSKYRATKGNIYKHSDLIDFMKEFRIRQIIQLCDVLSCIDVDD